MKGRIKLKIGFFDSGIGGLSVLHRAMKALPEEEYIFYMDSDHVPYGDRTKEEIIRYVDEAVNFLVAHDCKAVVIACNTATAVAAAQMREQHQIPIIGIEPAVKPAVENSEHKRVLVIATPVTVKEKKLQLLIDRVDEEHLVDLLALPQLVRFAENMEFDSEECFSYLKQELEKYPLENYADLVLGCTHYNYFKNVYRRIIPQSMKIIDGNEGTVKQLKYLLEKENALEQNTLKVTYYQSGREITEEKVLEKIESLHQRLEEMERIK